MKLSDVTVENYKNVYKYFGDYPLNRRMIQRWYAFCNLVFRPRVYVSKQARKDLDLIRDNDYHHIYVFNHRHVYDGYIIYAILHQAARYDIGKIRAMAHSICFEGQQFQPVGRFSRAIGFIPVFLKFYYANDPKHKLHPERLNLIPAANEAMYDCFTYIQTKHRQKVFMCPEGMYNTGAPDSLITVHKGAAEIASRVARIDGPVAITPIGFSYSEKGRTKDRKLFNPLRTSAVVGKSLFIDANMSTEEITEMIRRQLLSTVKKAVDRY